MRRLLVGYAVVFTAACHLVLFGILAAGIYWIASDPRGVWRLSVRSIDRIATVSPGLARHAEAAWGMVGFSLDGPGRDPAVTLPSLPDWQGQGAFPGLPFVRQAYEDGTPVATPREAVIGLEGALLEQVFQGTGVVTVSDARSLTKAISNASPGQVILLDPGIYRIRQKRISVRRPGLPDAPITLAAARLGDATLEMNSLEGFVVEAPYWVFQNLDIRGVCESHSHCEHAFHLVGDADGAVLRNNRIADFNAHLKANGVAAGGARQDPDRVLVEYNTLYNSSIRDTANPVTPIDVVGGDEWRIRGNLIADFAKARGNRVSYGAFLKGGGQDGIMEQNLVICEMHVLGGRGVRIGLSLGGGGSSAAEWEHRGGVLRNNIVLHCPRDNGIYLNRAPEARVYHNFLYNSGGIGANFSETVALVHDNILDGPITSDAGAQLQLSNNLRLGGFRGISATHVFADPEAGDFRLKDLAPILDQGTNAAPIQQDFCGYPRDDDRPDLGAIEYSSGHYCDPFRAWQKAEPETHSAASLQGSAR